MKVNNTSKSKDESYNNSKDFTKFSSRDFGCYDPKASTLLTFKAIDTGKTHRTKKHRSCKRPNWNFSATTLVTTSLFRPEMTVLHMPFPNLKDLAPWNKI